MEQFQSSWRFSLKVLVLKVTFAIQDFVYQMSCEDLV